MPVIAGLIVILIITIVAFIPLVSATFRYYSLFAPYGTGDTIVQVFHNHGGTRLNSRKWNAECMDGEAMVGLQDFTDDFEKLQAMWCRFMFPYKPSSQGVYPYFPRCHTRDYFTEYFCFNWENSTRTVNTFMTGLWDNEFNFYVFRPGTGLAGDNLQPYKCCKTPDGYYIDYVSCYYQPTHDIYFEYYDTQFQYLVICNMGFVMTGISKKVNPFDKDWHIEWIQCCRVGYGPPAAQWSPLITSTSGRPAYTGSIQPPQVPPSYQSQYRSLNQDDLSANANPAEIISQYRNHTKDTDWNFRYKKERVPMRLSKASPTQPVLGAFIPGGSAFMQ